MEKIAAFKIEQVPVHKMVLMTTTAPDYEMDRTILVEDYPDWNIWTVISGGHCSCYGFDETRWEAISYTQEEVRQLASSWLQNGYGSERTIAPLILRYVQ